MLLSLERTPFETAVINSVFCRFIFLYFLEHDVRRITLPLLLFLEPFHPRHISRYHYSPQKVDVTHKVEPPSQYGWMAGDYTEGTVERVEGIANLHISEI